MRTVRCNANRNSYIMIVNRSKEKEFFEISKDVGIGNEYIKSSFVRGDFIIYMIDFSSFNEIDITRLRTLLNTKIPELL